MAVVKTHSKLFGQVVVRDAVGRFSF